MSEQPIPRLKPERRPAPVMPGACETGGCGGDAAPLMPPPPSFGEVRVNGVEIDPEAIAREIQHHPAPDADAAWREAARALAIRELLLQEARRRGIEAEPEADEAGRMEAEDDAIIRELLDEAVEPEMPGDEGCRRYYEAQRHRFRTPDLFEAAHVLIEPESDDTEAWTNAERQARAIIEEVGDDATAFAAVAREMSACPSAKQDGSLGQVRRGDLLPAVQSALEAIPEGTVRREPVRSTYGWHVIRLHRKIDGQVLPFEAVRPKIAEMFGARGWSIAATRYVAALAAAAEIEGITVEPTADPAAL
ncbi:MAG TPA: peptidylprolyl isomerase [Paracoccaceae bacterium]|nr:peptidylprolyl isomerase [Paracoccaceae bacterium]